MGPKKPHRSSSTSGDSFSANNSKMLLETSFASLQQSPTSNSSITNGYFSARSHQPSPVISVHHQSRTSNNFNLSFRSIKSQHMPLTKYEEPPSITKSLISLNLVPNNNKVDLIHDDWLGLAPLASPESMSELSSISSRASSLIATNNNNNNNNIIVEICNTPKMMRRTPKIIGNLSTCADDVRNVKSFENCKKFPTLYIHNNNNNNNNMESSSGSNLSFESASSNNNNKCCTSDNKNLNSGGNCSKDTYLNITGCAAASDETRTYSISGSDFQSAEDILDNVLASAGCKEFFSSDPNILDINSELLIEETDISSPSSVYFINSSPTTPVYTQLLSPGTPQEIDPDIVSNLAIDLASSEADEQRSIHQFHQQQMSKTNSSIDSESVCCRTPSDIIKNVTFNPQVITVDSASCEMMNYSPSPVRWRLFKGKKHKHHHHHHHQIEAPKLLPSLNFPPSTSAVPIKTILSNKTGKKTENEMMMVMSSSHHHEETEYFSRTEGLPLLSGLNNSVINNERTPSASPNFVKRKKYVYPADVVVLKNKPHHQHESAV